MGLNRRAVVVLVGLWLLASPAWAGEIRLESWGPRVGIADDPDQAIVGVHFDLGEVARHVVFMPNVELGFGDDRKILSFNAPFFYRWENLPGTDIVPYAGGALTAAIVDPDKGDVETELGLKAIGGGEWRLKGGKTFLLELQLGFGDIHDIQFLAGWTFPR